jgi:hypothetical protein
MVVLGCTSTSIQQLIDDCWKSVERQENIIYLARKNLSMLKSESQLNNKTLIVRNINCK